jgi:hypothetical protein
VSLEAIYLKLVHEFESGDRLEAPAVLSEVAR